MSGKELWNSQKTRFLVVLVVLVAVAAAVYLVVGNRPSLPKVTSILVHTQPPNSAQEAATVRAFSKPGYPLSVVLSEGLKLDTSNSLSQCHAAAVSLSKAGTPTSLRALATLLPDQVAANLTADVVTAEDQLLHDCYRSGYPSRSDLSELQKVTDGLEARLSQDGRK